MSAQLNFDNNIDKWLLTNSKTGKLIHKIGGSLDDAKTRFRYSKVVQGLGITTMVIGDSGEVFDLANIVNMRGKTRKKKVVVEKSVETSEENPAPKKRGRPAKPKKEIVSGEEDAFDRVLAIGLGNLKGLAKTGRLISSHTSYSVEFKTKEGDGMIVEFDKKSRKVKDNGNPYHSWILVEIDYFKLP